MELTEREKKNLAILETLRRFGPLSKAEISKNLNLNVVTTSNYIDNLLKKRLVLEKELDVSEGGRRPVLLDVNPEAAFFVGIGINLFNTLAVLVDLKGNIISRTKREPPPKNAKDIVDNLQGVICETIEKMKDEDKIRGIGIGIAGIINKKEGSIRWPEKIDRGYNYVTISLPLKEILEKTFSLPVLIENDATCACFGERFLSASLAEVKNLIYMFSGVGCGIVINGEIFTGTTGCTGEPAIFNPQEDNLFNCEFASPCFLKRWEQDLGMVEEAKRQLTQIKDIGKSKILELVEDDIEKVNLRTIFEAAKTKDQISLSIVERAARRLGVKIAHLVNLLNPEIVVIGGGLEEAPLIFLEIVKENINSWTFEEAGNAVKVIYSELGESACAVGAASLVMQRIFSQ